MTLLETCERIVERHQYEEFDGVLIDAQTANLYTQIHVKLGAENRARLEGMTTERALEICWRLAK